MLGSGFGANTPSPLWDRCPGAPLLVCVVVQPLVLKKNPRLLPRLTVPDSLSRLQLSPAMGLVGLSVPWPACARIDTPSQPVPWGGGGVSLPEWLVTENIRVLL